MSEHSCAACGAAVHIEDRFCARCGAGLPTSRPDPAPPAPPDRAEGRCGNCDEPLPGVTTPWCPGCGANLQRPPAAEAASPNRDDATAAPPIGPPPGKGVSTGTADEPLLGPTLSAVLIGLAIVLILATVGILAGQAVSP